MQRGLTGSHQIAATAGGKVAAFIPHPLPPNPPFDLSGPLREKLSADDYALGRPDVQWREQQQEAARLDAAIEANLRGLGYGW